MKTAAILASLSVLAAICCSRADDGLVRQDIPYEDGLETFHGPARGYAPGGWTVFRPEGLPKWHGAKAFNSSLWELSRFSGGRLQGKKHPLCKYIAGLKFSAATYRFDGMPDLKEYEGSSLHKFMFDHMGYRFVVREARIPRALRRGGSASVVVEVENTGFGRLLLPSRIDVVLASDEAACAVPARGDVSQVPGGGRRSVAAEFRVPQNLAPGAYDVFLRVSAPLKDEKPGDMPRRPVRFANAGMWSEKKKANRIGKTTIE
ncbi:MAG: DUF4832 domain-containing protein [Kiritimatiellae bacterium]|nr:DUF4832 domain-containing protein [Kiritimatiellia bacterium]